ncbi:hypothetical protein K503DRAFT_817548 [Rhizopogon vinicolor AM-OR11-026]|uniref:Isopenicillin N synthase-like Fe(2+) 2OG dioxygenase domain-containing protein n=1 Tax=Rhizopogon vinicolor AM-OR11-026 TaxID=1314800 RepID=A0A1B7MDY0_9AGAM|nr:hypothetical protein K503DRAFT_817548 [Rhizopogon vinicolor AM-OR11-026]
MCLLCYSVFWDPATLWTPDTPHHRLTPHYNGGRGNQPFATGPHRTIMILWSQPVTGLQIQTREGEWHWIRHMDNALVINLGDGMEFLTGRADNNVKLVPMAESSVLQREGIERRWDDSQAPMMGKWGKERALAYGNQGIDKVNINGVSVGYYN